MLTTSPNKSWADQEEEKIINIDEENGIKTVVEEKIIDGKKVKITKKIKISKAAKKVNPIVEERKKWKKFGIAAEGGLLPDVTSIGEPIHFEYTNKKKQTTAIQTVMDDQELLLNRIQMQLQKEATEMKEETTEEVAEDENKLKAPGSGAYVPPSLKNKAPGMMGSYDRSSEVNQTIRVGNLDEVATEQDLRLLFGEVGRIIKCYLPGDRGRNRGFALITFSSPEEAELAIKKFDRFSLNHLLLNVEWSKNQRRY